MKNLKNTVLAIILLVSANVFAQSEEVTFDTYQTSKANASKYLLANDVALRDCPSSYCEKLTTIKIGTHVRLMEKSESPSTVNGVTSSWYKIKMGPQTGWIWGGLISQTTLKSQADAQVKFVFGEEATIDEVGLVTEKFYQIRAIKNGVEIDKILIKGTNVDYADVKNLGNKGLQNVDDVIALQNADSESYDVKDGTLYVIWKNNKFHQTSSLVASVESISPNEGCYVFSPEFEN